MTTVGSSERSVLLDAVAPDVTDLNALLWGPTPSPAKTAADRIEQLKLQFGLRREVARASVPREVAAEILGVTKQAVLDHLQHGDLMGFRDGRRWLLPVWQFDADSERGFLPGLGRLAATFPGGVVSLSRWVASPHLDLDGRTPLEALADGRLEEVVAVAETLTAAGW